jgi:glycosyltransferase involved in cell wall biosynthesis
LSEQAPLNLFYEEPDPDRWLPFDRYPRRLVRRLVRGPARPGGAMRAFLNLVEGLDRIGEPYRVNDYRHIAAHPAELACVFGKPHVLDRIPRATPILFGTSIHSHPSDDPGLPARRPIRRVLVPSAWVQKMFAEVWRDIVDVWPVGIDTGRWAPALDVAKDIDVLIYDKIAWQRERYQGELLSPLAAELARRGLIVQVLRYGSYREAELHALSQRVRSMVYLSRHETQGIAAQQMLSAGVPLFAWDEGGLWQDPKYAPDRVRFGPVTSVPYWDDRCGVKFRGGDDLLDAFDVFWRGLQAGSFAPRQLIVEQLGLEMQSAQYARIARACQSLQSDRRS